MSQPSLIEMQEYEKLREEFKLSSESGKHPRACDISVFSSVMKDIPATDMLRIAFEKCVRYNRYLELRTMIAPYLYDLLLKNGIKP
jgi:hypothetical protein